MPIFFTLPATGHIADASTFRIVEIEFSTSFLMPILTKTDRPSSR